MPDTKHQLVLHKGGRLVTPAELLDVATPAGVNGHQPVAHSLFVGTIKTSLTTHGVRITNEQHAIAYAGNRYFGLLDITGTDGTNPDYGLTIGLRNSHDKTFAMSLCVGSRVFVCDNLAFSAEVVVSRKHTRFVRRDFPGMIDRAIGRYHARADQLDTQIAAYKDRLLSDDRGRALITECLKRRIISAPCVLPVLDQWTTPSHPEVGERSVWRLFNAVTDVAKRWVTPTLIARTQRLHSLCNLECGLVSLAS